LVREAEFDNVGVFTFSDEEGTTSYHLPDRVDARTKQRRRRRLMALQKRISHARNQRRVGEQVEVLVEGAHPESDLLLSGRLASQAPEIDGSVIISDGRAAPGAFVRVRITEAHPYDLVARMVANDRNDRPDACY
jgi:ribosomal protein S12 methylthiotransferase